ncbi:MAG TPA: hypothetical protein PK765_06420 [bacterium]|nr:hypothetical protein [bacterium]
MSTFRSSLLGLVGAAACSIASPVQAQELRAYVGQAAEICLPTNPATNRNMTVTIREVGEGVMVDKNDRVISRACMFAIVAGGQTAVTEMLSVKEQFELIMEVPQGPITKTLPPIVITCEPE